MRGSIVRGKQHLWREASLAQAAVVLLLSLASPCVAQSQFAGRLGIFDEREMLHDFGTMEGVAKSIWVGLEVGSVLEEGFPGVEFSISGLEVFDHVEVRFPTTPVVVLGTPAAPADTTTGTGGLAVAWLYCQMPGTAVIELVLYAASPPENHFLHVRRAFPPSNPSIPYPRAVCCCAPCYCTAALAGGSYVLNPTVHLEDSNWSAVKQLYR